MATSSISGLVSGLDTASIIEQLMQLEAAPQNRLVARQTAARSVLAALQSLNTDVAALRTSAETLAKVSTWQALTATSSNSAAVTATATSAASPGSVTLTVDQVATAHQLGFTQAAGIGDVVAAGGIRITGSDGVAHDLATGGGTLQEVVTAINGSTTTTGVRATAVQVSSGSYQLLVQATTTGAASQFTLTQQDGTALLGGATVQQGTDAQVSLGTGITASSSTNTFTDLTPGLSITLATTATTGTTSTVTVARDASSVRDQVKALVDKVNDVLYTVDTKTATSSGTSAAGVLAGDSTARSLRDALSDTIFGGSTTSMAAYGLQIDRYGKLVLDTDTFDAAYAADPAATQAAFTSGATAAEDGWAARVAAVAKTASDPVDGTITTAINGRNATISRLQDDIDGWDGRLALRRTTLEQQFTALETALSTLKSQGDWLAGQIASLPTTSS